jgi:hypothetical protein
MKKRLLAAGSLWLAVAWLALGTIAAAAQAADATDHTAPSYDMKGQALLDMQTVQKKFVDLANAVPADKFNWRPAPDSRSFAEVFLHVAGERYQILHLMGAATPAGFDPKTFEKSTTDKSQIVDELNKSSVLPRKPSMA